MNIFNRIILVILLLGLIICLTALIIFPDQIFTVVGQFLVDWGQYFTWVDKEYQLQRLGISIVLAITVDVILILLVFLEIKPKRKRFIKVEQVNGGKATLSLDSITRQLLYRLDPLPGVIKVTPLIHPKGDKIQAHIEVVVTRDLAVPQMAAQLIAVAKQTLGDDLGLVMADEPQVRIRVADAVSTPAKPESSNTSPPLPGILSEPTEPHPALSQPVEEKPEKGKENWA